MHTNVQGRRRSYLAQATWLRLLLIPAIVACGFFATGCDAAKAKPFAEKAVEDFHTQMGAEQFAQIYSNASDELKKSATEKDFENVLATMHKKLGAYKSAKQTGFNAGSNNGVSSIKLDYETEYAEGKATETFIYKVEGEKVSLLSFNIESEALKK